MLFAVEGGGFFSASASGYSKGLSLLLLGQRNEDKPMRVAPWNHYQLVDQESDPQLQLAPTKNRLSRGCASFVCFGRTSAGHDTPSPLKVGPTQQHDVSPGLPVSNDGKDPSHIDDNNDGIKVTLKSSIRRPHSNKSVSVEATNEQEASGGHVVCTPGDQAERRRVQWTDACGSELVEIREFEPRYLNILFSISAVIKGRTFLFVQLYNFRLEVLFTRFYFIVRTHDTLFCLIDISV